MQCDALQAAEIKTIGGEVSLIPTSTVPIDKKSTASSVLKFIAELEDNDDVQTVCSNMDIAEEVMKELEEEE